MATQGLAPLWQAAIYEEGTGHTGEAGTHPCCCRLSFPAWHWIHPIIHGRHIPSDVVLGDTEVKGPICSSVSPDLPNSYNPSLYQAPLLLCM